MMRTPTNIYGNRLNHAIEEVKQAQLAEGIPIHGKRLGFKQAQFPEGMLGSKNKLPGRILVTVDVQELGPIDLEVRIGLAVHFGVFLL